MIRQTRGGVEGQHRRVQDAINIAQSHPDRFRQFADGREEAQVPRFRAQFLERFVEIAVEVDPSGLAGDDDRLVVDPAIVPERRGPIAATVDTMSFTD